jgi:hypothetical protein
MNAMPWVRTGEWSGKPGRFSSLPTSRINPKSAGEGLKGQESSADCLWQILLCVVRMLLLFAGMNQPGEYIFVGSLLLMLGSQALSI